MHSPTFEDWQQWHRAGRRCLPLARARTGMRLPASWVSLVRARACGLLESARGGRYTFLCDRPARIVIGSERSAEVWTCVGGAAPEVRTGSPLDVLAALLQERQAAVWPGCPHFCGGVIGVFGYDLVHTWERLPQRARRDLPVPLYAFLEPAELLAFDHESSRLTAIVWAAFEGESAPDVSAYDAAAQAADAALARWDAACAAPPAEWAEPEAPVPQAPSDRTAAAGATINEPSFRSDEFQRAVLQVQDYIAAGDTYQVNLSLRESRATLVKPDQVYDALRAINPSSYMGLLQLGDWALVCGSPELLVAVKDGVVSSRPIAGTRPRGEIAPVDAHYSVELLASDKERAEHLMLVDLIRNDLGRVAKFGSVVVKEFMTIERYSHVMHIVSQVEGQLAAGRSWTDVVRAFFPGGTITGCPKVRTMEIIEELEPVGRGFYTGSLGWIGYAGEMELNIVIRSMLLRDGAAHVQAGAGIVADSEPARELDEARRKAQALWSALDAAEHQARRGVGH